MTDSSVAETAAINNIWLQVYKLDRDSWVPLYYQIKKWLLKAIADGELTESIPLPSEEWIARSLSVSRMTARQALNDLRNEGYVVRTRGSGTFVVDGARKKAKDALQNDRQWTR